MNGIRAASAVVVVAAVALSILYLAMQHLGSGQPPAISSTTPQTTPQNTTITTATTIAQASQSQYYKTVHVGQSALIDGYNVTLLGVGMPGTPARAVLNVSMGTYRITDLSVGEMQFTPLKQNGTSSYLLVYSVHSNSTYDTQNWASINISSTLPSGFSSASGNGSGGSSAGNYTNTSNASSGNGNLLNMTPQLQNLGVVFAPWNRTTNYAGSFYFDDSLAFPRVDKIFMDFGESVLQANGTPKLLPHYTYLLTKGAPIYTAANVLIDFISWQSDTNDYEIQGSFLTPNGTVIPNWRIDYDHVINLNSSLMSAYNQSISEGNSHSTSSGAMQFQQVSVRMNAGSVIAGDAGTTELMIFKASSTNSSITTYCPIALMAPSLLNQTERDVSRLEGDWMSFRGDSSIYDQSKEVMPGCLYQTIPG
ncbi:MAG: hypothetical protein KGH69_01255 [Candidatus Micrarchaeota archaeon]|nr:hypothetical protein [Candidatus Micrarchaeota archaeon]